MVKIVNVLEVRNLEVRYRNSGRTVFAVNGLSFALEKGQLLALVGESGCGKTVTCLSVLGLNSSASISGQILFDGIDISRLPEREYREFRGRRIAMIFQDPSSSLNPMVKIGKQVVEVIQLHHEVSKNDARAIAVDAFRRLSIPAPEEKLDQYPHEQSGGTNQRIMMAIALSCNPEVLLADEPTSSVDATVRRQLLSVLAKLRRDRHMAILFVTHDLSLVRTVADRILIMYHGMLMEEGQARRVFENPLHPYTKALLSAEPLDEDAGVAVRGDSPSPFSLPAGCVYEACCQERIGEVCCLERPRILNNGRQVRCHWYDREIVETGVRPWPSEDCLY